MNGPQGLAAEGTPAPSAAGQALRGPPIERTDPAISDDRSPLLGDAPDDGDAAELYELLERASRLLDRLWNESRSMRAPHLSMQLGEASHSLHRTLIALQRRD